jgi:prepilin-type N-terminal cleavage/methylation domain-containing protein
VKVSHLQNPCRGFTLTELLISLAVLALLLVLILQLFNSAAVITSTGNKHMDADASARALLDRMGVDIGAMVMRTDVDYYLKSPTYVQAGDDQMAFYSVVPGYYPAAGSQSPVSLVAYRKNSTTYRVERLGKGLLWNGVSGPDASVVFLPLLISAAWPQAEDPAATDDDYEPIGPHVFRFEYCYVLKGQDTSIHPSILSDTPWDTRAPLSHTSISGLRDVAAIGVSIAIIDPKSRVLVADSAGKPTTAFTDLVGKMKDFASAMKPGELAAQWQTAVDTSGLPRAAASAIRIYDRTFYLNSPMSQP